MNKKLLILILLLLISKVAYEVTFYDYKMCRGGVYSKYPRGTIDANATYYKFGMKIGECGFFSGSTAKCSELHEVCKSN